MINWKSKLSSRKFWSLLLALIGSVLVVFKIPAGEIEQIIAIIGGFASVIVYILAEAYVDGQNKEPIVIEAIKDEES